MNRNFIKTRVLKDHGFTLISTNNSFNTKIWKFKKVLYAEHRGHFYHCFQLGLYGYEQIHDLFNDFIYDHGKFNPSRFRFPGEKELSLEEYNKIINDFFSSVGVINYTVATGSIKMIFLFKFNGVTREIIHPRHLLAKDKDDLKKVFEDSIIGI